MLQAAPSPSGVETLRTLPDLPSEEIASHLIEAAYLYTQARYCIVDWVQIREWHRRREQICYAGPNDDLDSQIGAYFIWIVYAIGARFSVHHEHASSGGPSVWHLVGICLRLCIELGYHRSVGADRDPKSAYKIKLQKRFFWCAYSFDRMISYISKRPFSLADTDIDIEVPLDIDLTCTDNDTIHTLQSSLRGSPAKDLSDGPTTEMSSVLHQLRLDRLRSRIMTRFMAPGALPPSSEEVWRLLGELDAWRQQVPRELPAPFPQHSNDRVHATQLHVALLLMRPVLAQESLDQDLLLRCAMLSADACENARTLSLNPQQQASPIQPTVLAPRRTVRAIVACSSALAIYSKSLATASIFLELFEKLADGFLGGDENEDPPKHPDLPFRSILQEIIASAPAEMPRILRSLSELRRGDTTQDMWSNSTSTQELPHEYIPHHLDFAAIGSNIFPTFDTSDLTEPFEIFYDMAHLYDSQIPSDN
ncbi:hypothetical protein FSARC_2439 [Fusarium sarcochroum]|uniref:Xylanolytic transcriptional activator regulatory domain-containing protein n=1 Tax=Fusarium sarcochroum TaxID=1208366 RepID=A0A8H4U637_9HYPO|nr:hypothetical protein FSARC_2439 [Fusarium sarcochroum]